MKTKMSKSINTLIILSTLSIIISCGQSPKRVESNDINNGSNTISYEYDDDIRHEMELYQNKHVKKWITYFASKDRERFQRFIERGMYYKEVIQTVLEEEELPYQLYYLPLIESGFNQRALSHAGAVGPWQFIKGTGRRYGLAVNRVVDERHDPIHSTEAATKYLKDLYNVFNSWELAIAAYNCGEIRVLRAIMKGRTRNFWELVDRKLLPRETRNYVPKFLAAAYVGENLEEFGFDTNAIAEVEKYPDLKLIEVPGGVRLAEVAKHFEVDRKELERINPALKYKRTPNWIRSYAVWLPRNDYTNVEEIQKKLSSNRQWGKLNSFPTRYKVRRGDSLIRIARKYKISLKRLKRINGIKGSRIYPGQKLTLRLDEYKGVVGKKVYFVKKNDFLGKIARRHGLSVSYLRRLNGLYSNRIYIGQKLDVTKGVRTFRYRVKRGDSLSRIARLYNTTAREIRRRNSLSSNNLFIGQMLRI
ncbi:MULTISPECIES: lytic transglycosylase domain-containing protein [Halobacteriovorax]|uniref:LysM peptidoglycan-binding domain-containing protein n=1 Tax=Halobacteriovorax vibrionivorans TaxID=2152716 RepID=A0ABY0IEV2_9BACT|nr:MULTISPECIES: lytic transglycosylase domain-containing protein [Halobacteriovorax]RZF21486.1 LysM peptidoglycan-binding domain-containing protein [Halobacteriovorax vibrionivorans]TGD48758.1 LysM peptidoglycan-binding domain-containing protein [Halobacteriovorax sp. Y22]